MIHDFSIDDIERFSDNFVYILAADDAHYLFLPFFRIPFLPIIIYMEKFCTLNFIIISPVELCAVFLYNSMRTVRKANRSHTKELLNTDDLKREVSFL